MLDGIMPNVQFNELMAATFTPLTDAAGRPDLLAKLKTAKLPPDREFQIAKMRSIAATDDSVVVGWSNAFICRFTSNEGTHLAIACPGLTTAERAELASWASSEGLGEGALDESAFLYLRLKLGPLYRLRSEYQSAETALEVIDVVTDEYLGHDVRDVMGWYEDTLVLDAPNDAPSASSPLIRVYNSLSSTVPYYRAFGISADLAARLKLLNEFSNMNPDNIYMALSSFHGRQIYLELYKCIEALYFLPWAMSLKKILQYAGPGRDLAAACRNSLRWRENEKDSIAALFDLCPKNLIENSNIFDMKLMNDIDPTADGLPAIVSRRIYKLRNVLVHQEDYEDSSPIDLLSVQWEIVLKFMSDVISHLYTKYDQDISFNFISKPTI